MKRKITWTVVNAAYISLAWFATAGSVGAGRVLIFAAWYMAITSICVYCSKELKTKARSNGRSVPRLLSESVDLALVAFLVYHGWWTAAIATLIAAVAQAGIMDLEKETTS